MPAPLDVLAGAAAIASMATTSHPVVSSPTTPAGNQSSSPHHPQPFHHHPNFLQHHSQHRDHRSNVEPNISVSQSVPHVSVSPSSKPPTFTSATTTPARSSSYYPANTPPLPSPVAPIPASPPAPPSSSVTQLPPSPPSQVTTSTATVRTTAKATTVSTPPTASSTTSLPPSSSAPKRSKHSSSAKQPPASPVTATPSGRRSQKRKLEVVSDGDELSGTRSGSMGQASKTAEDSQDNKKAMRAERNRQSAAASRERKKRHIKDLEDKVKYLGDLNNDLQCRLDMADRAAKEREACLQHQILRLQQQLASESALRQAPQPAPTHNHAMAMHHITTPGHVTY